MMKRFSILTLVLVSALFLSACGARATPPPTINPIDMQITAAAVALTMVAQTQAAIPTATLPPPTETFTNTPPPTNTLPASGVTSTPVPSGNSGGGEACTEDTVLPDVLKGKQVKIRLNNSTKVALRVSVYLNQSTPQGQCGYRAYNVEAGQPLVINDLVEGCYTIYAWNPDPEGYFIVTNGTSCISDTYPAVFDISKGSIKIR